jgi:hypothetical protein
MFYYGNVNPGKGGSGGRRAGGKAMSAKARYKMREANKRWKRGVGKFMPEEYAPRYTRRRD